VIGGAMTMRLQCVAADDLDAWRPLWQGDRAFHRADIAGSRAPRRRRMGLVQRCLKHVRAGGTSIVRYRELPGRRVISCHPRRTGLHRFEPL
jgi:hypothetical protein